MPESTIINEVLLALVEIPGVRAWRSNVGLAVPWSERGHERARPVMYGIPGQADITGIAHGWRLEVECKTEHGQQTEQQKRFEAMVCNYGGIYFLARSGADAKSTLTAWLDIKSGDAGQQSKLADREEEILFWEELTEWLSRRWGPDPVGHTSVLVEEFIDACDTGAWHRRGKWTP